MLDPIQPLEYETGLLSLIDTWQMHVASTGFEPMTSAMPILTELRSSLSWEPVNLLHNCPDEINACISPFHL